MDAHWFVFSGQNDPPLCIGWATLVNLGLPEPGHSEEKSLGCFISCFFPFTHSLPTMSQFPLLHLIVGQKSIGLEFEGQEG